MKEVRLLVSRTNVGEIGDVVEYDDALAANHVERGLVEYVNPVDSSDDNDDDAPAKTAKGKKGGKRKGKDDAKDDENKASVSGDPADDESEAGE